MRDRIFILKAGSTGVDEGVTTEISRAQRMRSRVVLIAIYALRITSRAEFRRV